MGEREGVRFLITLKQRDMEALDKAAKRRNMTRNRYVMLAINAALQAEPAACPICGLTETHTH